MASGDLTRWFSDHMRSHRVKIAEHPSKTLARHESEMANLSPEARLAVIEDIKHRAKDYYRVRHGHDIPYQFVDRVDALEEKALKMNDAEVSSKYVKEAGHPEKFLRTLLQQSKGQNAGQWHDTATPPKMTVSDTIRVNTVPAYTEQPNHKHDQQKKQPAVAQSAGQSVGI